MRAVQTLARSEGGLGLGLSLVNGLVALHGGEVAVASAPAGGAEFVVRLPVSTDRTAAPEPHAGGGAAPRRHVLVMDDNHDAAETVAELARMFRRPRGEAPRPGEARAAPRRVATGGPSPAGLSAARG